jgi:hypothetical protein
MPASGTALAALIKANVASRMAAVTGQNPLAQKNPSYFIEMCTAIGTGIITGGPTIDFTTIDAGAMGAPPIPGVGVGIGITTDPTFFVQDLYTRLRGYILAEFGKTSHDPYPPGPKNSGLALLALCQGINDSFLSYYPTAWTLASVHPLIYAGTGQITNNHFSGLVDTAIKGAIMAAAPSLQGQFWPKTAQGIAESYVALIEQHSTGMVTINGICVPGPSQVCGITSAGSGTGTAT